VPAIGNYLGHELLCNHAEGAHLTRRGCAVGPLVWAVGIQALKAQVPLIKRTELLRVDIKEDEGREGVMFVVDLAPGAVAGRHFHPGPEFFYVLEGTVIAEPDGQPPVILKKGETGHNPTRSVHNAKNGSASEPAQVLVFLLSEKGKQLATPVE
jgi:quercetin dioxygenase-like cupin family protein